MSEKVYPDLSDIYARKAEARRASAGLSFGEKIALMEALRERMAPFKKLREERRAQQRRAKPPQT